MLYSFKNIINNYGGCLMNNDLRFDPDDEAQARRRRAEHAGVSYGDGSSRKKKSGGLFNKNRREAQDPGYRQLQDTETDWESPEQNYKRRSRDRRRGGGCLKPLLSLFLFAAILLALLYFSLHLIFGNVEKADLDQDTLCVSTLDDNMDKYQNIVLFGVDNQDNEISDTGSRTDSIIIASINKSNKDVKLMSIYRDTYVSINGNYDKINAAYAYGGPEMAVQTINRNLDLNVEDYATINFKALADAVDIMGGIELTIKSEKELENLNDYIGNMNKINGGDSPTFDDVGTYTFDGNQAVAYSRIRYMEGGDHERANHQRLVLQGLSDQMKAKPWKIPALISKVLPQCKTSLSSGDLAMLTMSGIRMNLKDSKGYPFHSVDARYNGIYYGFPLRTSESLDDYSSGVVYNAALAHQYLFGTENYQASEELEKIGMKVKNVTDELGY